MKTNIAKWGASCAVRIPKMAVEMLGLHEGQKVKIEVADNKLIISKVRRKYKLEDLVKQSQVCEKPEHEFDDPPQGKELL